jgi:predicted DNA-binding transcriptional regulator YafY
MSQSQQLLRQWKILQMLADSRVGYTVQELMKTFHVSLRSIQRDIEVLQVAGFPLEDVTIARNQKRWKMKPLSEQMGFNFADMISIIMSRRFLEPLAGTPFWEGHQKVYRKVRGSLGEQALKFCEQLNQTIRVSGFGASDYTKRGQIIDTILLAMEDKHRVLVSYQSQESTEPIEQELGPQGFIWHNGSLYLIAWSARRQEIRNYKVDRIQNAEIGSDLRYAIPESFSLEDWQKRAFGVFGSDGDQSWPIRIHFTRDAARYVQESWWHDSQKFVPGLDGAVEMHLELNDLSSVTKWILSFGRSAIALEPPALVDGLRSELTKMLENYSEELAVTGDLQKQTCRSQ